MSRKERMIAAALAGALMLSMLTGCSRYDAAAPSQAQSSAPTSIPTAVAEDVETNAASAEQELVAVASGVTDELDETQRNCISILNHLAVLTQEINASQNSRMYLEEAYSLLINNTLPNAVDSRTLSQLTEILDALEKYRMIAVKRERLDYVYEQNRAQALRSVVPNPLGLLGAVKSFNLSKLAITVVHMPVDSYTSYTSHTVQTDMQYLREGWKLDDEAATALHESRKSTFSYMIQIVGDYGLPGDLTLSESAVDEFVQWETNDNVTQRLQFLEANVDTYQVLGTYWIVLAESYYENGDYGKCIDALASYEALDTRIFRKDYEFARVLPLAVISAGQTLSGSDYVASAEHYLALILDNTDYDDWVSHYFAAQTYIDLHARTGDASYLEKAYELTVNNVNCLVNEQRELNTAYLAPVVEVEEPKDATREQKEEIKAYNRMLKETRKTELPPVSEPLLLNCELLFALAEELDVDRAEQERIDRMLHGTGDSLFLSVPIDNRFRFESSAIDTAVLAVTCNGKELTLPASLVSGDAVIRVRVVSAEGEETVFDDWTVSKVERKTEGALETFSATYTSASARDYTFRPDATITILVYAGEESAEAAASFTFATTAEKTWLVFDTVGFARKS